MTPSANLELNVAGTGEKDRNFADLSNWFSNLWDRVAKERIQVIDNGKRVTKTAKEH